MENNFATYAERYVKAGFAVLPLIKGKKIPLPGSKGSDDATLNLDQIKLWSQAHPEADIGARPGITGKIVLDFDKQKKMKDGTIASKQGLETLRMLQTECPDIELAWKVETPSGSLHYWFSAPPGHNEVSTPDILPGLDIRHMNTYVVMPPSTHPDFPGEYRWISKEGDLPPLIPHKILEILAEARKNKSAKSGFDPDKGRIVDDELAPIPDGYRKKTLLSIGARMRVRGLDQEALTAALNTIDQNRCIPPLGEHEVSRIVDTNMKISPFQKLYDLSHTLLTSSSVQPQKSSGGNKKLKIVRLSEIKPEETDWLMESFIAKGRFTLFFGMEKQGKSYCLLELSARISRGQPLPGKITFDSKPGKVCLITYEDSVARTMVWRLNKLKANMDNILVPDPRDLTVTHKNIAELINVLDDYPDLQMLVIDPLQQYIMGVNEKENNSVREAFYPMIAYAERRNIALVGIKHATHDSSGPLESRVAGSRAWTQLARTVILCGLDHDKEQEDTHKYGAMMVALTNDPGSKPIPYEIHDGEFIFFSPDPTISWERLFPKPPERKK